MKNSTGDIRTNEAPEILDLDEDENPVYDTSTVRLSSPVPSDQAEQPTDTQSSNATTITLSSPYDTSTGRLSSPVPSDQAQQLTDTQTSNATTITLSSQEQTVNRWEEGQDISTTTCNTKAEKECQTTEGVYLSNDEYESLLRKASFYPNFQNDLLKITSVVSSMAQPEMDPNKRCYMS